MASSKLAKLEGGRGDQKNLRGLFDFDESLPISEMLEIAKAKSNEFHNLIKKSLQEPVCHRQ